MIHHNNAPEAAYQHDWLLVCGIRRENVCDFEVLTRRYWIEKASIPDSYESQGVSLRSKDFSDLSAIGGPTAY